MTVSPGAIHVPSEWPSHPLAPACRPPATRAPLDAGNRASPPRGGRPATVGVARHAARWNRSRRRRNELGPEAAAPARRPRRTPRGRRRLRQGPPSSHAPRRATTSRAGAVAPRARRRLAAEGRDARLGSSRNTPDCLTLSAWYAHRSRRHPFRACGSGLAARKPVEAKVRRSCRSGGGKCWRAADDVGVRAVLRDSQAVPSRGAALQATPLEFETRLGHGGDAAGRAVRAPAARRSRRRRVGRVSRRSRGLCRRNTRHCVPPRCLPLRSRVDERHGREFRL